MAAAGVGGGGGISIDVLQSYPSLRHKSKGFLAKASVALAAEGIDDTDDLENVTLETLRASPVPALVVDALWKEIEAKRAEESEREAATCKICGEDTRNGRGWYHPGPILTTTGDFTGIWKCCNQSYEVYTTCEPEFDDGCTRCH